MGHVGDISEGTALLKRKASDNSWKGYDRVMNIGFVGLGIMGSRIAKRLMDAGHTVIGWNRTKSKADELIKAGMAWADTPREVSEQGEVIIGMLYDSKAVEAVAEGEDGLLAGLSNGKVYIEMATQNPIFVQELAAKIASKGASMLDVPVSGSVSTVESGKLSMMVGGDKDVLDRVMPVLLDIGPTVTYVGSSGKAVAMKIALNFTLGVQLAAFSEALVLAEQSGIPLDVAIDVYTNSVAASPFIKYKAPFLLERTDEPAWFDISALGKDMSLAEELSNRLGVPLEMGASAKQIVEAAISGGLGERDIAYIYDAIAKSAGMEVK